MSDDDWRLQGQEQFLQGRTLTWAAWTPYREGWDHDHCAFCWAEISDQPIDDHAKFNVAWVTADDHYTWICPACFDDFESRFQWATETPAH